MFDEGVAWPSWPTDVSRALCSSAASVTTGAFRLSAGVFQGGGSAACSSSTTAWRVRIVWCAAAAAVHCCVRLFWPNCRVASFFVHALRGASPVVVVEPRRSRTQLAAWCGVPIDRFGAHEHTHTEPGLWPTSSQRRHFLFGCVLPACMFGFVPPACMLRLWPRLHCVCTSAVR